MRKRWPQINFKGIEWGIYEPESGYLDARTSCQAVVEAFIAEGGTYRQVAVTPTSENAHVGTAASAVQSSAARRLTDAVENSRVRDLNLSDGSKLQADIYVFACGPWLGKLFPKIIGELIPTKQDIFFFGPPAGDNRFTDAHLPVWADHGERFYYGIPGSDHRGFKIADDTRGPDFDPTNAERIVSQKTLERVREYLALRFPSLKDAPLVETRVCQYEQTPDSHFIIDRHPKNENVWFVGGGSGHGFKHGPAIGEMIAELILNDRAPNPIWQLKRFQNQQRF